MAKVGVRRLTYIYMEMESVVLTTPSTVCQNIDEASTCLLFISCLPPQPTITTVMRFQYYI